MKELTRFVIKADGVTVNHAWTEEKARKIAFEYEYHCGYQDEPCFPKMEITKEVLLDDNDEREEKVAEKTTTTATETKDILCGFVYCHGAKDFSLWECDITPEDREAIEKILAKYECEGSSVRNAYEEKLSDMVSPEYF